jgi:hypothetical protein
MNTTSQSPGSTTDQSSTSPQEHLQTLKDDANAAITSAKEHGAAQFEQYRDTAAQQIETLAQSAQSAAEQMGEGDTLGLSHYVTDIAQSMTTLAGNLRGKSIDELLQQAGKLARDNPALFVTGSVALGFGLSRFLRASGSGSDSDSTTGSGSTRFGEGSSASASQASSPAPMRPDDEMGSNYTSPSSTVVQADHVAPVSHPHMGDVYHSGRPGVADRSATPDAAAGSFVPTDPIAGRPDDGLDDSQRKDGPAKGDL